MSDDIQQKVAAAYIYGQYSSTPTHELITHDDDETSTALSSSTIVVLLFSVAVSSAVFPLADTACAF